MDCARPYQTTDKPGCLAVFDSNVPDYFLPAEREGFAHFLDRMGCDLSYQVIERDGRIAGCGGHAVEPDGVTASLCWGMIDNALHRQGLGRLLTQARIEAARGTPGVTRLRLDTSQHTSAFYARFGFETVTVTPDGYGDGLDRCEMILTLEPR
jgi:N-acetylglutamate synthase-like GNAT family acetyltransferase